MTEQPPANAPTLFPRWLAGVGLALVIVALAVGSLAWKAAGPEDTSPSPSTTTGERTVAGAHVDVEGGVLYPYPTRPGRVVEMGKKAREGTRLEKGDLLLRVDDTVAKIAVRRAETALKAAKTKLRQAKLLARQHQLKAKAM